jgi:hypothetical protein
MAPRCSSAHYAVMTDDRLVQHQATHSARPSPPPSVGSDGSRIEVDRFKVEAQTIDCHGDDIERGHWKKLLGAVNNEGPPLRETFSPVNMPVQPNEETRI